MRWCPKCSNYLYHKISEDQLNRQCLKCGYSESDQEGGLVLETRVQERASEGYKILLNEFTPEDPTLPHVKNIKCPNEQCPSNVGSESRDVIYIKYDATNLKYLYICTKCPQRWRSR